MAGSEKLVILTADKVEFLKRCAIKSIPVVAAIIEKKNSGRRKSGDAKKKNKKEKPEVVETPKKTSSRPRKKKELSPPPPAAPKSASKKKTVIQPPPAIPSSSSSDSDSEDLKEKEKESLKRKLKEKEDEKRRKREKKEKEEKKEKKRKIEDSDDDNFKIVIESATDSEKEEEKPVIIKKKPEKIEKPKQPEKQRDKVLAPQIHRETPKSSNKKVKNVGNKDRKQTLLEFNCLTAPQLEIKEINEFLEMRNALKEYGISKEYRMELDNFPEEQLLTCDSDACPFLLQYQRPFSALYEEARRKWTPILESPSGVHLKNKCVTCDKKLTTAPYETWRKFLGSTSFYCSIKCISTKVASVLKDARDAETITVMNLLTGETVRCGIYTREIRSFCLLAPNWMPLSVDVTTSSTHNNYQAEQASSPKKIVAEKVEKKQTISQKIPKKSADQNESLRNSTRQSFENSMFEKSERYRIRLDRREIRDMAMVIEDRLFEKCDKNISHPNYRIWKQQFLQNFEQEKAKNFVFNVLKSRISIEKLVAFDAAQLRNPACWQVRQPTTASNRKSDSRVSTGANSSRVGVSPLDAIIGDDNRDTTAEHLSHAFSKNCRVCQSKQLADAQEKIKKENEERDLRDRREKNRTMMEEMRKEDMKRKQERKEQKEKEKEEAETNGKRKNNGRRNSYDNNDYFDDDYGGGGGHTPTFDEPDFASTSFRTHRSSVEPSSSRTVENDDWKISFNLQCGESNLRTEATPIFNHIEQNLALMKMCRNVVHRKRLDFHSPLRMQEFLIDSHTAMNIHKTCSIAVLRMMPTDSSDRTYKEILGFNMEKEMVGQLQVDDDSDFSELLSVFLFPHKGSEIVHDTLAPLKYTVGTSEDCFLMLFIVKPEFAARFKYSCRMSDIEMREQINTLERERMAERSWRQSEPGPNQSWRREAPRTPQDLDLRATEPQVVTPPVQNSVSTPTPVQSSVSEEVETISQTKTKIILNIIANTERLKDVVDSTKDFMHDTDVSEDDKSKVKNVIEQRISEEKRKKKEEKLSKDGTGSTRRSLEEFTVPPPQPPVFLNTSIPPPMVAAPVLHPTQQQQQQQPGSAPLSNTAIFTASQKPPSSQHPFGFPPSAGYSQPPPILPTGVTAPMALPPGVTDPKDAFVDSRSDEQIVADAIRKGQVAPIPEALLLSGPRSSTQPSQITELMEREKRRIINQHQQRFTEVIPPQRRPPPQNNWGAPEERYRRPREERENWQRELSPPQAQRYRTPSPPQRLDKKPEKVEGSQKNKKEEKNTDDLFPLRFGRQPKKRAIIPDPIAPKDDSNVPKKRGKRSRGGKKHRLEEQETAKINGQPKDQEKTEEEHPPPPPPPESDSETSESPSPPLPPTNIVKPPIFEVNKPPAPPPLSSAPPSNVPLPVPPPPPPTTTTTQNNIPLPPLAAIASSSKTSQFSPAILLPPPPPPPSDVVLKAPTSNQLPPPNFHHHYNPPPPQNSNYSRQNYPTPIEETEWSSSPQQQQHHQNYSNYNGMGTTPRGPPLPPQIWRGGSSNGGPSPRGMYRGNGNMGSGGMRGRSGGLQPPNNFYGDSPRNHQMPRGNWRGRGRGNYW